MASCVTFGDRTALSSFTAFNPRACGRHAVERSRQAIERRDHPSGLAKLMPVLKVQPPRAAMLVAEWGRLHQSRRGRTGCAAQRRRALLRY